MLLHHSFYNYVLLCLLVIVACFHESSEDPSNFTALPSTLKIGALLTFNSTIGRFALQTIQLAIQDINKAPNLLNGSQLVLEMFDSHCDAVQGAASAVELMKQEVVAVVGPQSSAVSQFVAHIASSAHVPFVSFAATDPNLSELQYPYFLRVAHSDQTQMEAVAALISNYGWREVAVLHMDDDLGKNGVAALWDSLQTRGSKVAEKVALDPWVNKTQINSELVQLANMQTRIFVVHTDQELGFQILTEASNLDMMTAGYVWIVTDLIASNLASKSEDARIVQATQGILGTRWHIPHSLQLESFLAEWKRQYPELDPNQLNAYGLFAYDSVWTIARAVSDYLQESTDLSFTEPPKIPISSGGESELARIKIFQGGAIMRKKILQTSFYGASGPIKFDNTGDREGGAFEYINMVGKTPRVVGYWTNQTSVSVASPNETHIPSLLVPVNSTNLTIVWPGGGSDTPTGWVLPNNGKPLRIGVPRKAGYNDIVGEIPGNNHSYTGFCIEVFKAALKYLPYAVPYEFEGYGNAGTTPIYEQLVDKLVAQEFDAIVGDLTITSGRLKIIDITQPYIESGLVVLVPLINERANNPWAFLRPFTATMWCTIFAFFVFTGLVIWTLEHKVNEQFRGSPKKQIVTLLSFTFSTMFFAHKEDTRSFLGRFILVIWLFVVLIINSSYTANLTSILTVEQLIPGIQGLDSLLRTNGPIGYQTGSFVKDYLIDLKVSPERLKNLSSREMYQSALDLGPKRGGVAAIVDELPYVQLFLSTHCDNYTIAGQEFTKSGWGFAFPRGSEITPDMSEAILKMSQTGELAHIRDFWFKQGACDVSISGGSSSVSSSQLGVKSFWGLFVITGAASVMCLLIYMVRLVWEFTRQQKQQQEQDLESGRRLGQLKSFAKFVDEGSKSKKRGKDIAGSSKSVRLRHSAPASPPYPAPRSLSSSQLQCFPSTQ